MWNSEEVVLVKTDQLGVASALQPQVALLQEGSVPVGETQTYILPAHGPLICISLLDKNQEEEKEQEAGLVQEVQEEVGVPYPTENDNDDDSVTLLGDAVSLETSMEGGVEEQEMEIPEEEEEEEEEEEVEAEVEGNGEDDQDPDYDPAGDPQGLRAFPCQQCQRRFTTRQGLERHAHIHTVIHGNAHALKCRFCTKTFGTQLGRRQHERGHESQRKRFAHAGSASSAAPVAGRPGPLSNPVTPPNSAKPFFQKATNVTCIPRKEDPAGSTPPPTSKLAAEEGKEHRGAHVCKHCHKAFGTHTNLRRHQRRVHERHLLPRRLISATAPLVDERKDVFVSQPATFSSPAGSPGAVGGAEEEVEVEREEYMVDISSNISENLSFYIDGKIVSTSAVSGCEVIEVNSAAAGPGSAAVIGLDALILSPAQIAQALQLQASRDSSAGQSGARRRRTATPPLLPQIKSELESEPILTTAAATSSSTTGPSSAAVASFLQASCSAAVGTVVGTVLSPLPSTDSAGGGATREKTVYLSPKLKQLLQNQEGGKATFALLTDGQQMAPPPLSLAVLPIPAVSTRFKRRTGSPPNAGATPPTPSSSSSSPAPNTTAPVAVQHNPGASAGSGVREPSKEGVPDSTNCPPPLSLSCKAAPEPAAAAVPVPIAPVQDVVPVWPEPRTGGSPCNQQPLDLSSRQESGEGGGESALDLSMPTRSEAEGEEAVAGLQLHRAKPSSSVLQQVLMSDYTTSLAVPGEEGTHVAALVTDVAIVTTTTTTSSVVPADPEGLMVELALPPGASLHSSPPSLIPVAKQPMSPSLVGTTTTVPTPPPALVPAASSVVMVPAAPAQVLPQNPGPQVPPETPVTTAPLTLPLAPSESQAAPLPLSLPLCLTGAEPLQIQPLPEVAAPPVGEITLAAPMSTAGAVDFVTAPGAQLPALQAFAASVSDSALQSYSIIPNAVVIECTVSLESSQTVMPAFSTGGATGVDSPYGKIITLAPPETLQPYPSPQLDTPKETTSPDALEPNVTPPQPPADPITPPGPSTAPPPQDSSLPAPPPDKQESQSEQTPPTAPSGDLQVPLQAKETTAKPEGEVSNGGNPLCGSFVCNVCSQPFPSMKELGRHVGAHSEAWPYKCEFCLQLFTATKQLLEHRSAYHGIGTIYVCSVCTKDFAFLCNLQQHQRDLHPGLACSHAQEEDGRLRPHNYNCPSGASPANTSTPDAKIGSHPLPVPEHDTQDTERVTRKRAAKKEEEQREAQQQQVKEEVQEEAGAMEPPHQPGEEFDTAAEELYTTIKIMASGLGRAKGPDVRLGINQHYPSYKPPPFPYHNRTPAAGSVASATNFTTHNIPQTFSTAIRCTKCGLSFDNMPELHKHILACANASDRRRYTPKKNPIPLKQFAHTQNGVLAPTTAANIRQNISSRRMAGQQQAPGPGKRAGLGHHEPLAKLKLSALQKRKAQLVQKAVSHRQRAAAAGGQKRGAGEEEQGPHVCPHCHRGFTYRASLSKHVALSCPSKPAPKKGLRRKEGPGATPAQENLRLRSPERKQQGVLMPSHKLRAAGGGVTLKRAAILGSPATPVKRSKSVLSPIPQGNATQRQGRPAQHGGDSRGQSVPGQTQKQPVGRLKVRERHGGPVTRSLQQARTLVPPTGLEPTAPAAPQITEPLAGQAGRK